MKRNLSTVQRGLTTTPPQAFVITEIIRVRLFGSNYQLTEKILPFDNTIIFFLEIFLSNAKIFL